MFIRLLLITTLIILSHEFIHLQLQFRVLLLRQTRLQIAKDFVDVAVDAVIAECMHETCDERAQDDRRHYAIRHRALWVECCGGADKQRAGRKSHPVQIVMKDHIHLHSLDCEFFVLVASTLTQVHQLFQEEDFLLFVLEALAKSIRIALVRVMTRSETIDERLWLLLRNFFAPGPVHESTFMLSPVLLHDLTVGHLADCFGVKWLVLTVLLVCLRHLCS